MNRWHETAKLVQVTEFKINTLGCKVNQFESEAIAEQLQRWNFKPAGKGEHAKLVIVNTCTVTRKASMQSRQAIRQAIRENPGAKVIVTGCYAQTAPEEIHRIEGVHTLVGQTDKHRLPELILVENGAEIGGPFPVDRIEQVNKTQLIGLGSRSRPFLKIQDGCDAFCSYCIVPYARGSSRSLPVSDVVRAVTQIENAGYHEVVLTGIHLGLYGQDLKPPADLLSLLKRIRQECRIDRIRLSSIEPREISAELLDFLTDASEGPGRICPHFHIPLQSGDDGILKRMRRPYSSEFYRDLVLKIHDRLPEAAVGADVLVGFPGETESAFRNTYRLIAELPVTYLHVFPFSRREGTAAYHYPDPIPPGLIQERCREMRKLGKQKKSFFYNRFIGRRLEVLLEPGADAPAGYIKGTSSNYIPVLVAKGNRREPGLVEVTVDEVDRHLQVFGGARPVAAGGKRS